MSMRREPIPPGTLEMLILQTISRRTSIHGFEIAEAIAARSEEIFEVEEGSLYPALQRLLAQGLITGEWGRTSENRRARYYSITAAGRQKLGTEVARYRRVANAINLILQGEESAQCAAS
jgi:transcriptional regulator